MDKFTEDHISSDALIVSHRPRPVALVFLILALGLTLATPRVSATTYTPYVLPGDQAVYGQVSAYWASTSYITLSLLHFPLGEFLNVSSILLVVQNVSGTKVIEAKTRTFTNQTKSSVFISGDVQSGVGTLSIWTIASGLKKGDPVFSGSSLTINSTIPMTFAGVSRPVDNLTRTYVVGGTGPERIELLWDQATGILVSFSYSFSFNGGINGSSKGLASLNLTSTSLWSAAPDFGVNVKTLIPTVSSGASQSIGLNISSLSGFTGMVQLATSSSTNLTVTQPSPLSVSVNTGSPVPATFSFTAPASSLQGSYVLSLTATSGSISHVLNFTVQINGDFKVSVDLQSLTVPAGTTGTVMVTATSLGIAAAAALSAGIVQGAPLAIGFSQTRFTLTPGNSVVSEVGIHANSDGAVGTYIVVLQVGEGTVNHSVTETVYVTAASSSTFGLDPTTFYGLVGVLGAIAALGVIVYLRRRPRKSAKAVKTSRKRKP
jgi:hypothetical protein